MKSKIDPNAVASFANQVELIEKEGQYLSRTIKNGYFHYCGNQNLFAERIKCISESEREQIIEASIILTGSKIHVENSCKYKATLWLGVIFLCPLLCFCCSCWQRTVYPLYEVDIDTYQLIKKLVARTDVNSLTLVVYDNKFNQQKGQILKQIIVDGRLRVFNFRNRAFACDYRENQKSMFKQNMKPVKELLLDSSRLQWDDMLA